MSAISDTFYFILYMLSIIIQWSVITMFSEAEILKLIACSRLDIFYNSYYWRKLSHQVIKQYNGECLLCKSKGLYSPATLVHHVKPIKEHPSLAYSVTYVDDDGKEKIQLMPLCQSCHEYMHHRFTPKPPLTVERWWPPATRAEKS